MSKNRIATSIVGFPRIGEKRELKKALESYWNKQTSLNHLLDTAKDLRARHWKYQKASGIDLIPCNDFSLYDNMLDMVMTLGALPERFKQITDPREAYFAMARGTETEPAMAMSKWMNTNYHYIVPELSAETVYSPDISSIREQYREALSLGIQAKINLIGPVSFLLLSRRTDGQTSLKELYTPLLKAYETLIRELSKLEPELILQFDEPMFAKDPSPEWLEMLLNAYQVLTQTAPKTRIIVQTYFDQAGETVLALKDVPVWGIGLDFLYGIENLSALKWMNGKMLFAGIVDGRNIWKNDLMGSLSLLERIEALYPREKIVISTSCSLLHVPYSLEYEQALNPEIKLWMSYAREKLDEVSLIAALFFSGDAASPELLRKLEENQRTLAARAESKTAKNENVREKIHALIHCEREAPYEERSKIQKKRFGLPLLPTTTIGSYPQTEALRTLRKEFKTGTISREHYDAGIRQYIDECVAFQEEIGLSVLVHGEPERNDMVEYFGERLAGFAFTENGWVQSYGSRCVKPPVIYGDVERQRPMTVDTIVYAQSRTKKIMKGMLTGPVTILNWSFVRNDIARGMVSDQIALALKEEVDDLQQAGIQIIQVDEAAFREGYPLRNSKIPGYESWAVRGFKTAVSSAKKETQIHTHMCYSDFNDIIHTIEAMDADVITIETSRNGNRLLSVFKTSGYPRQIGPGVYDIHSPRIPSVEEFKRQILSILEVFPPEKLWINPDCGLKTRQWPEVQESLRNMVAATEEIRQELQ